MKQPDAEQFKEAMEAEILSQLEDGVYSLIPRDAVPLGVKIFQAVWQMKRERDITTGEIKRHKARNNLNGSVMEKGVDFQYSYAAVASWTVIRIVLAMATALNN